MLKAQDYFSRNKDNQVICDKCGKVPNVAMLFPHKKGLCVVCKSCSNEEIILGNLLEIESPEDHPMQPTPHYKFEDI